MFGIGFERLILYFKCLEILWIGALENTTKHIEELIVKYPPSHTLCFSILSPHASPLACYRIENQNKGMRRDNTEPDMFVKNDK